MNTGRSGLWGRGRAHFGVLVLALFGGAAIPPAEARAQVAVDELEVHVQLAPGRVGGTQVVPVRNELDRVQQVRVSLGDWQRDSIGRNVFLEAGSHPSSCGERVQVFPMTFQIAPGAVEYVRVSYESPADLAGCWSIVFFETVTPPRPDPDRPGSFLTIEVRTGVKLYVHAAGAVRAGEITYADVVADSAQTRKADLRFANTGSAHLKLRVTAEIRDLRGTLLHKLTSPEAYMTPGSVRDLALPLPTLPAGDYVALLLADFGGDEITAAQVEFRIP